MESIKATDYILERLNKENLKDLSVLHAAVYGKAPGPDYYKRKYDTAYTGISYAGYIAYNNERRPIAYYGVIPCFIEVDKKKFPGAQSADTMTDPGHRFKGMFVELSNHCFDLCRKLGIRLVFGFPNENSYHGAVNKLRWKMTERMSGFKLQVKTMNSESLALKARLGNLYRIFRNSVLRRYELPLKGVANSVIADGFGGVYRDEAYLNYKTYNPSRVISLGGVKLWISDKQGMLIGDIEGATENNFAAMLEKLQKLMVVLGTPTMQFHCSTGTRLHDLFAKHCERSDSYHVLFQDFGSPVEPERIKFTFGDVDVF